MVRTATIVLPLKSTLRSHTVIIHSFYLASGSDHLMKNRKRNIRTTSDFGEYKTSANE